MLKETERVELVTYTSPCNVPLYSSRSNEAERAQE